MRRQNVFQPAGVAATSCWPCFVPSSVCFATYQRCEVRPTVGRCVCDAYQTSPVNTTPGRLAPAPTFKGTLGRKTSGQARKPRQHWGAGKKIPTDKGWDFGYWWSWGDLNPRPQIFLAQIYMFSVLFCISPCKPRRRTLMAGPAPLFLACAQGARKQASR